MILSKINPQDITEEKQTINLVYIAPEERSIAFIEKNIFFRPQERTLEELAEVFREHLSESKENKLEALRDLGIVIIGIWGHTSAIHRECQTRAQELMEILDRMEIRSNRGVVFLHEKNIEELRESKTIADFAWTLTSEIQAEVMMISRRIEEYDVTVNIEKETPKYEKNAKYHHKFHNQKPSKAKGIYWNSRRK